MRLLNTGDSGVNGTQVNGFSFTDGTITGAGDASDENSITFDDSLTATPNLTGVVTITNNVISQTEAEGIDIENWAGTITNATISNNALVRHRRRGDTGLGHHAHRLRVADDRRQHHRATITNNTITDFRAGVGVQVRAGNVNAGGPAGHAGIAGSATDVIAITGNLMNGGNGGIGNQPDRFFTGRSQRKRWQGNFNISNNGTAANRLRNIDCIAIEVQVDGPVTMTSTVQNNFINANSAVGCAGIAVGTDDPSDLGAGTHTTLISGNNVMGTDGPGIFPIVRDSGSTMTARVLNNTVAAPIATNAARAGIRVDSGSATGDTTMCLEISGNTTAGSTNTAHRHHLARDQPAQAGHRPGHQHLRDRGPRAIADRHTERREPRQRAEHQHIRHLRRRRHRPAVRARPASPAASRRKHGSCTADSLEPIDGADRVDAEHREQRGVDLPLLVDRDVTDRVAETVHVDGTNLLDEHRCRLAVDVEPGSKRRGSSARRGRRNEHNRPGQHRVGLHDDAQSPATLLVSDALGQPQLVDVPAFHGRSGSQLFRHVGDGTHLGTVGLVCLQCGEFDGECSAVRSRAAADTRAKRIAATG